MDINCGTILDGEETVQQAGQRIFERILRVASGERTQERAIRFRFCRVRALADRRDRLNAAVRWEDDMVDHELPTNDAV